MTSSESTTSGLELWEAAKSQQPKPKQLERTQTNVGLLPGQRIIKRPRKRHGLRIIHKSEWQAWINIWRRCHDPRCKCYKNYGGRGITLCERWHSFASFLEDMGPKPSGQRFTIERKNNDGNYEPENCKWATYKDNLSNRRVTVLFPYNGQMMTIARIAEFAGMKENTLYGRIFRGKSLQEALAIPVKPRRKATHVG